MDNTIIGLARHVMLVLGKGHREHVYGKALEVGLNKAGIRYRSEICCPILFMGEIIGHGRADFIVEDIVIEIKANKTPPAEASDQLAKYLKSLNHVEKKNYRGLILNFNQSSGKVEVYYQGVPVVVSRFWQGKQKAAAQPPSTRSSDSRVHIYRP